MTSSSITGRKRTIAFTLLALTQFVLILDAAIVNVALPSIGRDLDFAPADLTWVTNAYTLLFGGFLLLGGRVADLVGRRRLFIAGLTLFAVASLVGAFAQSSLWLVIARATQGLGAALVSPAALSLVMTLFPEGAERNKALGIWAAAAGTGGAAGSILGGVLTDALGWESVLWVNVPVGIAAVLLAPRLLPEGREATGTRGFDLAGAVSVTAGLALLVYALVDANDAGWGSTQTIGLGAIAVALIAAFVAIESRSDNPLVPLRIFRNRTLRGANVASILTTMAMFPLFFFLTLYTQQVLGYSAIEAGLAQLPIAITIMAGSALAAQLVTRLGARPVIASGLLLAGLGLLWFAQISPGGSFMGDVFWPSLVVGLGAVFAWVGATIAATNGASEQEAGLASGLLNTSQQIGGALGLAVLIAVATARTEDVVSAGERVQAVALTEGYQSGLIGAAAIAVLAAVLAALLLPGRTAAPRVEHATEAEAQPAEA
jgi:EmrB/QacA subfamily drug resistance transporter